ncbi:thiamine ABC transporter substrate-binding protein [Flavimobilis marinus]|uniref:Thiamine transport system substrate-binding protein n=1 Tax=Flavimobilis marinus TaxID=285351 RepID=A0A1I2CDJ0_9MICO|nr:thiamine ABC transporter substrate-binding protein [Flavimobilis marinus]GHG47835.1 thiamine ABC transporter substrate-binding protein [Flavimobilis marinus]SFE66429.1 thiamine transport system substrate-binding protein [Flavimobilis marinus]
MHAWNRRRTLAVTLGLTGALALTACGADGPASSPTATGSAPADPVVVTLVSHDSFSLSEADTAALAEQGIEVEHVKIGDGGTLVNQLVLTKDAPLGDVVYGIDNTFASRAVDAGVFEPYTSPSLPEGAQGALIGDALTPVDQGDVCINVDDAWFAEQGLEAPTTLDQLADEDYRDLLVVTNPATSTPGLGFLLATIGAYGEDGYLAYWQSLVDNGLKVVDSWEDAYYTDFTQGEGTRPLVLSYGSSPAYTLADDGSSTTSAMLGTCFRQVEYAGILQGQDAGEAAQLVIEHLLSDEFQRALPENVYMYPVADVPLPEPFEQHAALAPDPITLDPATITANRDDWIQAWSDAVLG